MPCLRDRCLISHIEANINCVAVSYCVVNVVVPCRLHIFVLLTEIDMMLTDVYCETVISSAAGSYSLLML